MNPNPGLTTEFRLAGRNCAGSDARVEVRVFPPSAMVAGPLTVLRPPVASGSWSAATTVGADAAQGTYTFEATCFSGNEVQFTYASRHVHFGEEAPAADNPFQGIIDAFTPDRTPKPSAAAGQAVPGAPRYTG
jgi:hypothetical protein